MRVGSGQLGLRLGRPFSPGSMPLVRDPPASLTAGTGDRSIHSIHGPLLCVCFFLTFFNFRNFQTSAEVERIA